MRFERDEEPVQRARPVLPNPASAGEVVIGDGWPSRLGITDGIEPVAAVVIIGPAAALIGASAVLVPAETALAVPIAACLFAAWLVARTLLPVSRMRMRPDRTSQHEFGPLHGPSTVHESTSSSRPRSAGTADIGREAVEDRIWALRDEEQRHRELLDRQPDVIARRNAFGVLTFVNQAYCETFGVTWNDVIGTSYTPPLAASGRGEGFGDAARISGPGRMRETVRVQTVKGPRWFDWSVNTLPGLTPEWDDTQSVGRDITDQRDFAEALKTARDAAEAANAAKSRFLAAMSHEIRTPLNGIIGLGRALQRSDLAPRQVQHTDSLLHSAETLRALIDDILDFSRIEAGHVTLSEEPVSLQALARDVIGLLTPKAEAKGLSLTLDLAPDLPDAVIGDPLRLRQLMINTMDNAIKFTQTGGAALSLSHASSADRTGDRDDTARPDGTLDGTEDETQRPITLTISDTGPGFKGMSAERLFTEFEQGRSLPTASADGLEGAGLGLAICRRLVTAMDGTIAVGPAPDGGAMITIDLPLAPVSADTIAKARTSDGVGSAAAEMSDTARETKHATGHAVIVEDNRVNALVAASVLEDMGWTHEVVGDGEAAIARLHQTGLEDQAVDAVLLDMRLPGRDGLSVFNEVEESWDAAGRADRPLMIALTANAFPEDRTRCLAHGFDAYFAKPFNPDALAALLTGRAVNQPRQ